MKLPLQTLNQDQSNKEKLENNKIRSIIEYRFKSYRKNHDLLLSRIKHFVAKKPTQIKKEIINDMQFTDYELINDQVNIKINPTFYSKTNIRRYISLNYKNSIHDPEKSLGFETYSWRNFVNNKLERIFNYVSCENVYFIPLQYYSIIEYFMQIYIEEKHYNNINVKRNIKEKINCGLEYTFNREINHWLQKRYSIDNKSK